MLSLFCYTMTANSPLYESFVEKVNSFSVFAAKNYGRKMPSSSFIYVVLAVGQDSRRTERRCHTHQPVIIN